MSFTGQRPRIPGAEAGQAQEPDACAHCGAPLEADQEWCLRCGDARTFIHPAPDWRIAAALILTVALLALIGLAIAVINLSDNADRELGTIAAGTSTTVAASATPPVSPPAKPAPRAAAPTPALAAWPPGLSGWTVVLGRGPSRAAVTPLARRLAARGLRIGILSSGQHPFLHPGYWVVFSGRYPGPAQAIAAAARLRARGLAGEAREVAPPPGR